MLRYQLFRSYDEGLKVKREVGLIISLHHSYCHTRMPGYRDFKPYVADDRELKMCIIRVSNDTHQVTQSDWNSTRIAYTNLGVYIEVCPAGLLFT